MNKIFYKNRIGMRLFKALEEKKKKEQEEKEVDQRKQTLIQISNIKKYKDVNLLPTLNYIIGNVPILVENYKTQRQFSFSSKGPLDVSILHELQNSINVLQTLKRNNKEYLHLKSMIKPSSGGGGDSQLLKYATNAVESAQSIKNMYEQVLILKERKNNKGFDEKLREQYKASYNRYAEIFNKNFEALSTALIINLQKFIDYFNSKLSKYSIKTSSQRQNELAVEQEIEKHQRIQEALARQFSATSLSGGKKYKKKQQNYKKPLKLTKNPKKTNLKKKLVRKSVKRAKKV